MKIKKQKVREVNLTIGKVLIDKGKDSGLFPFFSLLP